LRQALNDSAENPRYIETIPRLGYRFIATVEAPVAAAVSAIPEAAPVVVASLAMTRRGPATAAAIVLAAVLCAAGVAGFRLGNRAGATRHTIAVLPFENVDRAADEQYIADGLTEELTTELSRLEPKRLAVIALQLDPDMAEAHLAAGWIATVFDRDWQAAGREFSRTLEIDPHLVRARALHAVFLLAIGRSEEAVQEIRRAMEVDPMSLLLRSQGMRTLFYARHYDEVIESRVVFRLWLQFHESSQNRPNLRFRLGQCAEQASWRANL
jgi:tetratricopeptide (TPR) repeat protein